MRIRVIYGKGGERKAEWRNGELVYASDEYLNPTPLTHFVMPDLPDYQSPVDGRVVSGRRQRREDLRRTGSRPWEGLQQEKKEAARRIGYEEKRMEQRLTETAHRAMHQISYSSRRILEGR